MSAIPKEQARCRELLAVYKGLGDAGWFGAMVIEQLLAAMDQAVIENDIVKMILLFEEMIELK